jgi:hypothetical protein
MRAMSLLLGQNYDALCNFFLVQGTGPDGGSLKRYMVCGGMPRRITMRGRMVPEEGVEPTRY